MAELEEIYVKRMDEVEIPKNVAGSSSEGSSQPVKVTKLEEKMVVGFDDVATRIIQQLDGGQKKLNTISIVGLPGVGKTTLAGKVYSDSLIQERFAIRGWIVVSQVYNEKDLLIDILKSTLLIKEGDFHLRYNELGEQLLRRLRDKKYLVVFDDIWSVQPWKDISRCFPDDSLGSGVMFTTRLSKVGKIAQHLHNLQLLLPGDSWELLQRRVFGEKSCPYEFVRAGMAVAKECGGLPLAIVVIAGILKKTPTIQEWWHVAACLSSIIAANDEVCMKTLALSYNQLPVHLKPCFLYLGAFPEDYEFLVRKLTWIWIARGFVEQSGKETLEAIAEGYLMDLIGRSLVMVSRKSPGGGIEACRIHDLLRQLCRREAKECPFFGNLMTYSLCNESHIVPNPQTFLCLSRYYHDCYFLNNYNLSVLDLSLSLECLDRFPEEVVNFIHLRFLAIAAEFIYLPPSISNLWKLETLILYTVEGTVDLPEMGNTTRLRHILVKSQYGRGRVHFQNPNRPFSSWDNLQTLDRLCPCEDCLTFLKKTRNLKRLGICWDHHGSCKEDGCLKFRDEDFSKELEELKLFRSIRRDNILVDQLFPQSIMKLTLEFTYLEWEDMTIIGKLPRLEVLKLLAGAFANGVWKTNEDEFRKLKYLRIQGVYVSEWNSCDEDFPKLETLVLRDLPVLKKLPSGFGELTKLEKIVVTYCDPAVEKFARDSKEERYSFQGENYRLEVLIT